MEKRLSYRDFQSVKSVAKAIDPQVTERAKIKKKIEELALQYKKCDDQINLLEAGVVKTIGVHVTDLIKKVIEPTGALDKNGKPIKATKYLPTDMVTYDEAKKQYVVTLPDAGSDNDIDAQATVEPVSSEVF